jgi:hypothetical protein
MKVEKYYLSTLDIFYLFRLCKKHLTEEAVAVLMVPWLAE